MDKIIKYFEDQAFGVCTRLGDRMGLSITSIRLFFIYASFLALGSPVLIYLALAFIINIRRSIRRNRNTIWY